ncbi:J domain-containing protein DDB_G0295729-like [Nothobranchius furzeri]|uniref:J domain-containing protein DDB_G0295729-like n=1 Tax=Nothobranchius furzeri TaxID=105023 RepID=UPI003904CF5B
MSFREEHGIFIVERPATAGVPEVIRILDEDEGRYPALHIPDDDVVFVGHGQAPPVEAEFTFEGLSSDDDDVVFVGHGQAPPVEAECAIEGLSRDFVLELERAIERLSRDEELELERAIEGLSRDEELELERAIERLSRDLELELERTIERLSRELELEAERAIEGLSRDEELELERAIERLSRDEELEAERAIEGLWSALEGFMASSEDSGYGSSVLDSDEDQQLPPLEDFWLAVAPPAPPEELPEDPRPAHGSAEEVQDVEEPTPSTSVLGSSQKRTGERFPYIPPKRPRWDDSDSD